MKTAVPRSRGFCWLPLTAALILATGPVSILAQVIPATPKKFTKRIEGSGGASIGPGLSPVAPKPPPILRTTMYYTVSDSRQWTSSDGKPLLAKLIIFEEAVIETQGNQTPPPPTPPAMPANPTVVRDGKVRLLSGTKPYEVPLERLSQPDRDFIEGIRTAVAARNFQTPAAPSSQPQPQGEKEKK
jgi:hypothetical protein